MIGILLYRVGAYTIRRKWLIPSAARKNCFPEFAASEARSKESSAPLEDESGCEQVMHLIAGVRGAIAGLMAEVVEDHVLTHLVNVEKHPGALNVEAAEQLLEVIRTYLK